jgi:hypothetical protein
VTTGSIDDPAFWDLFVARDSKRNLSGGNRRGRHIETKGTLEIRGHRDRNWIGAEPRLSSSEGATCLGDRPESAVASPIIPSRIAIIG